MADELRNKDLRIHENEVDDWILRHQISKRKIVPKLLSNKMHDAYLSSSMAEGPVFLRIKPSLSYQKVIDPPLGLEDSDLESGKITSNSGIFEVASHKEEIFQVEIVRMKSTPQESYTEDKMDKDLVFKTKPNRNSRKSTKISYPGISTLTSGGSSFQTSRENSQSVKPTKRISLRKLIPPEKNIGQINRKFIQNLNLQTRRNLES